MLLDKTLVKTAIYRHIVGVCLHFAGVIRQPEAAQVFNPTHHQNFQLPDIFTPKPSSQISDKAPNIAFKGT